MLFRPKGPGATVYDVCDGPILYNRATAAPGAHLRLLYLKSLRHPLLKWFVLSGCRHASVAGGRLTALRETMAEAMAASPAHWRDEAWINRTFAPIAEMLDQIRPPRWQQREEAKGGPREVTRAEVENLARRVQQHIFGVWDRHPQDPYIPVQAQVMLSGDDRLGGAEFLDALAGIGSFACQNAVLLFALARIFSHANEQKLALLRKPYAGIAEPLRLKSAWISHRTAFYDVIFFEQLYARLTKNEVSAVEAARLSAMLESLLSYIVVTSQEWLTSPAKGLRHPALTCLPKDAEGRPLCRLKPSDWKRKSELGFGDYVPDVDTTFLGLSMARKWLDLTAERGLHCDGKLREACEAFLDQPWPEIIGEYQVGGPVAANPPTMALTKPLDYYGAVPLWFHKPFPGENGCVVTEMLGNEICPGHNMDIVESLLVNRRQWGALSGENLETLRRFVEFHRRAFSSGNFREESAVRFYLPPVYVHYAGRVYDAWLDMSEAERALADPQGAIPFIRDKAIDYCREEVLGATANAFDAALAVSALCLLRAPKDDGAIQRGLSILIDSQGEGKGREPYLGYEWTLVRLPTRIIVGSAPATSLFVLNACTEALAYLYA